MGRPTTADIRTLARGIAEYITYECDGVAQGFEIEYNGLTAFVDYRGEQNTDTAVIADVWNAYGHECPDIADALQLLIN